MSNLKKNIEGIDIPPDVLRIIEEAETDGSISSVKDVLKNESSSLIEQTKSTFKELCRTLDDEQTRLTNLEEKRKRLQQEMLLLKAEIEKEKESCRLDLEAAGNLASSHETTDLEDFPSRYVFQQDLETSTSLAKNVNEEKNLNKNGNAPYTKISNDHRM